MTVKSYFREGDRVKAQISTPPIRAGMVGTILRVFMSASDTYDVQFDDLSTPRIMHGDQLVLVKPSERAAS